ncbi:Cuticlin-1 [Dirofilaria immitis]
MFKMQLSPLVDCGNEFIRFSIKTVRPFQGKIFVKGQHGNSDCSRNYTGSDSIRISNSEDYRSTIVTTKRHSSKQSDFDNNHEYGNSIFEETSTAPHCPPCPICRDETKVERQRKAIESIVDLNIKLGTCNTKYEQQIKPRAVLLSLTVVVSFHQNLLTKLDRAFRIQCAYMEDNKAVDADLNVSMPSSVEVESKINSPKCYYAVKSPSGKIITNVRVGELVEHEWICHSPFKGIHAMLVKNCYAESNDNSRIRVIDEHGCTLDPYILPNLRYSPDLLSVKIQAPIFKFPDRSEIAFRCEIFVCLRDQRDCKSIIPPKCINSRRKLRQLPNVNRENLILRTSRINVIDLDDSAQGLGLEQRILNPSLSDKSLQYCLTITRFVCIVASATFLITITKRNYLNKQEIRNYLD